MKWWLVIVCFLLLNCTGHKTHNAKKDILPAVSRLDKDSAAVDKEIFNPLSDMPLLQHHIHLAKGIDFDIKVIKDYEISIASEEMNRLRFLTKSPDGKLFATDMNDQTDNHKGRVYIFTAWDSVNHVFLNRHTFLTGLHNPNQVCFYNNYIYVAETDKLSRYTYNSGDTIANGMPQVIATFPAYGLSYKYGGWHLTRSLAFHNNKLYISVGSSCNACIEKEEVRASVLEMNPDGSNATVFANGLRNSVAIKWIGNKLWGTGMGRDLIGADIPEDLFQVISRNVYYGWPFYYQHQNKIFEDPAFKDSIKATWVKKPPLAFCGFKAHSAPLGFDFFTNFNDPFLKNAMLVALHGSTTVSRQRGNAIVKIVGENKYIDIVTGFLQGKSEADRYGRPCDILMNDDHSFFITDDKNGILYYLWKKH